MVDGLERSGVGVFEVREGEGFVVEDEGGFGRGFADGFEVFGKGGVGGGFEEEGVGGGL